VKCVFTQLCECHLEFEKTKRPSSFCFVACDVAQGKEYSYHHRHLHVYISRWMCFCTIVSMPFEVWKDQKALSCFCFDYFSSTKNFNHIAKAPSILHLKLGGSHKPDYFLTSTPSDRSPISLTHLLQAVDFLYGKGQPTYYNWSILMVLTYSLS
jgi:hypothetical protein